MEKTILITGRYTPLSADLVQGALSRKHRVLVTVDDSDSNPPVPEGFDEELHHLAWNPRSPLSARSVILSGTNTFDPIDEAIVVLSANGSLTPIHETPAATIEAAIDASVKGYIFLVKEIVAYFQRRKAGTLSFVVHEPGENFAALSACASGCFRALAESMFSLYQNEPILMRGFRSETTNVKSFAEFVLTNCSDRPEKSGGKWHAYADKASFFSFKRG
ncbi:MAG: hypothetical protein EA426_09640 [Spirochaetaceae bacterium]|nr:MAG: hypothetical protein EA426_09640 [Spirochaetaceae bacterium]